MGRVASMVRMRSLMSGAFLELLGEDGQPAVLEEETPEEAAMSEEIQSPVEEEGQSPVVEETPEEAASASPMSDEMHSPVEEEEQSALLEETPEETVSASPLAEPVPSAAQEEFMEDFFQQHATIPAEMLGDAMHLLNMNPTADEVTERLASCGSPATLSLPVFRSLLQEAICDWSSREAASLDESC